MLIPMLSQEEKAQLIMELMAYSVTRDRIWGFDRPRICLANLIRTIYTGTYEFWSGSNYLVNELKKAPELYKKLGPYFS